MPILILEPQNETDYRLFIDLAKRLQTPYRQEDARSPEEREAAFLALAGSLDTPETGDELIAIIEGSRTSKDPNFTF
ncbi:MAG: hypothetical protein LH606_08940 [Cytophagaceae bacterium]|nr:hypothetical protein [Cytophagaceae bacterium]